MQMRQIFPRLVCLGACAMAALLLPRAAAAQKDAFVDAVIAFRTSLAGTSGDEGSQVRGQLDRMAAALDEWDRTVWVAEAELRARLAVADATEALQIRTTLGSLYLERGRLADALAEFGAAIALAPDNAAFHLFRGLVHEAAGAPGEALKAFRQAWAHDPVDPVKAYLVAERGSALGVLDDLEPQIEALMSAQLAGAGPAPISFITFRLVEDRAADWPVFSPAAYAVGFASVAEGRYEDAIASFRAAASRDPLVAGAASRPARMAQGIASLKEKRFAEAVEHLEAAVASAPESSEAHRLLGVAYVAVGRQAERIEQLEAAVRLAPGDERARIALGRALMSVERWEQSEQALRNTLDALPQSAEARWALADLYERRGRGLDAIRELEAAAALPLLAGRGELYWRLAELRHVHQDFEGVTRELTERARLDRNRAGLHKDLGLAHMRQGSREAALVELLMTLLLGLEDGETLATIGQIHLETERYEAAEAALRRAIALAPDLAQARFALGTTLVRLGRAEEGREQLAEFQRLRTAALEEQRRTFDRLADQPAPDAPR